MIRSIQGFRQLVHVDIHVEPVSVCQRGDRGCRGAALAAFDAPELALGKTIHLRLANSANSRGLRIAAPYRLLKPAARCFDLRG